jgi:Ni/Co efflux regulator RcnB
MDGLQNGCIAGRLPEGRAPECRRQLRIQFEESVELASLNIRNHYKNVIFTFSFGSSFGLYCLGIDNQGVPIMKRIILSAVALSMLAATSLQSQAAPLNAPNAPQSTYSQIDWKKSDKRVDVKKRVVVKKKVVVKRNHWRNGQRYSGWKRHQPVRDYRHYGLRRPGRGQEWIRVGNDYLLVSVVSGIIFGAIAAR